MLLDEYTDRAAIGACVLSDLLKEKELAGDGGYAVRQAHTHKTTLTTPLLHY